METDYIEAILILLVYYGLATVNLNQDEIISVNMYDNGKYIFKNNIFAEIIGQEEPINKQFDTIDELYDFVIELLKTDNEQLQAFVSVLKKYNLEYKYTTEPLNDENLFLNVVERAGDITYKYYIYNGKEYNEIGGDTGPKILDKIITGNDSDQPTRKRWYEIQPLTFEEFELISSGKAILHVYRRQEASVMGKISLDFIFLNCQSFSQTTDNQSVINLSLSTASLSDLGVASIENYISENYFISSQEPGRLYYNSHLAYNFLNDTSSVPGLNLSSSSINQKKLVCAYDKYDDYGDIYLNSASNIYTIYNSDNELRGRLEKPYDMFNTASGSQFTSMFSCVQINLYVGNSSSYTIHSCVINNQLNSKGLIQIYDTTENKVTYVEISELDLAPQTVDNTGILKIKAYKDGQDITTDFLANQFYQITICVL